MTLFDSHCHLDDEKFAQDREEVIQKVFDSGVGKLISAGYSLASSQRALQLARKYPQIYTTCGISPNDLPENVEKGEEELKQITQMAKDDKVVGIGEIGLDYYWNTENKARQQEYFIQQIAIANELQLPIVIHTREAVMDTLTILKENPVTKKGVFHCCPLNPELVKEALKLGFYISLAGPVTFKNAKHAQEVIQMVPEDRILIETDSPYLSPEPERGKRNDPSKVRYIAQKVAAIKEMSQEEIAQITYQNACRIFAIPE